MLFYYDFKLENNKQKVNGAESEVRRIKLIP